MSHPPESSVVCVDPYLSGLEAGEIRALRCDACGAAVRLVRYRCTACGSGALSWRAVSGAGVVYAVTTVSRAPSRDLQALAPYTLVLVELDGGGRVMGHAWPDAAIGARVQGRVLHWDDRLLLHFHDAGKHNDQGKDPATAEHAGGRD